MFRAISILGFGGGFLIISPNFRSMLLGGLSAGVDGLDRYSPWSYVACAVVGLLLATVFFCKGSQVK